MVKGKVPLASFPDLLLERPDPCCPGSPPTGYQLKSDTSVVKWIKEVEETHLGQLEHSPDY